MQPRRLPGPWRGPLARPSEAWAAWRTKIVVGGDRQGWDRRREGGGREGGWRKGRRVGRRLSGILLGLGYDFEGVGLMRSSAFPWCL